MRVLVPAVVAMSLLIASPSFAQAIENDLTAARDVEAQAVHAATPVASQPAYKGMSKWWAAAVAAGPIFDGVTTWWAMSQSGPAMKIREGNGFYQKIFGADAKGWEIMAVKTGQAAILAWGMHEIGRNKEGVERVVYSVVLNGAVSVVAGTMNIKRGMQARRLNATYSIQF